MDYFNWAIETIFNYNHDCFVSKYELEQALDLLLIEVMKGNK